MNQTEEYKPDLIGLAEEIVRLRLEYKQLVKLKFPKKVRREKKLQLNRKVTLYNKIVQFKSLPLQ